MVFIASAKSQKTIMTVRNRDLNASFSICATRTLIVCVVITIASSYYIPKSH